MRRGWRVGGRAGVTYQTTHWLKHLPFGIVLSQKNSTGLQKKMAPMMVQQDQAKMKAMRLRHRIRNRRYGKMRRYCRRIENLVRKSARL